MRLAKPILLVTTPLGVAGGLYEAHRLAGGLVFLMAMLVGLIAFAIGTVVLTIRREERERRESAAAAAQPATAPERSEIKAEAACHG